MDDWHALTFLGTGDNFSMGVQNGGVRLWRQLHLGTDPQGPAAAALGAGALCTSSDPRDRRLRPSAMLRWRDGGEIERVVVIDTGPDFREQALRSGLKRVDAVFYTHSHADHILGLDDLRPLSFTAVREGGPIPLYAAPETAAVLEQIFDYTFLAAGYLSEPRACAAGAAGALMRCMGWSSFGFQSMHGDRWRSRVFAWAARLT
jgi:ribonuclease BN (tRNA processing enzyme)